MKKVLVKISDNKIIFKNRRSLTNEYKNMLNTNIISDNELLFTDEYIINNQKIVKDYLKSIIKSSNIKEVVIENNDLVIIILNVINTFKEIETLTLTQEIPLTYGLANAIMDTSIKNLKCYSAPDFMLELFDKKGIKVFSENEVLFLSNFMKENDLNTLSNIFYKNTLNLKLPFNKEDEEDFKEFCNINKYLKKININKAIISDLDLIIKNLKKNNLQNVTIIIHEDITDNEAINYLKKYNDKYSQKDKIRFKLNYSQEYLEKNFIPETNVKILRTCCLIIILIVLGTFSYVFYDNYKTSHEVSVVQNEIQNIIETNESTPIVDNQTEETTTDESNEPTTSTNTTSGVKNRDLKSLLSTNSDTVGWLTVKHTNIDYAVVQSTDNEFYLSHNFYQKASNAGWVFMDYRNSSDNLDDNTIIYAHDRYSNGTMFGTLRNTLTKSWYTNDTNLTITFNTIYHNMQWKVFSIYRTPLTNDYLIINFGDDENRLSFYQMLHDRSDISIGDTPMAKDKILTLSTCTPEGGRLVLHAVLVSEE